MKKLVYMAVLALITATGIFWSCQKEETLTNPEERLMLKSVSIEADCESDCITPGGPYFIKTYKQYYDEVADKWVQVDVYNTATQIVYEITSSEDIIEIWDVDADTLFYANYSYHSNNGNIKDGTPATQPFIIAQDLATDWLACDEIENKIRVTRKAEANPKANGNSQTFESMYNLIGVCSANCEESFSYETADNKYVTFTYVSDVFLENAEVKFTCPQIDDFTAVDGKEYNVNPGQVNGTDNVLTWIGDIEACIPITFTLDFEPHCTYNDNSQKWNTPNVWTDFKVNGVSIKGDLPNIVYTGCSN